MTPLFVSDIVEGSRFGAFQRRVLALCTLIAVVDGFDVTAMALVAPSVATDWSLEPGALGPALSASLIGMAFGGAIGGPMGDRFGRRPALIMMFLAGLIATAATATASNETTLILWRFLTGLGLGGTIPLGAALTAEYMPKRLRAFLVVLMFSGHPLGGTIASFIAPALIETWGWHSVFIAGGVLPLAMVVLLMLALPESPRFVATRGDRAQLVDLLKRVDPGFAPLSDQLIVLATIDSQKFRIGAVFADGRAAVTAILWAVFFATQFTMFVLSSWLPTILNTAGITLALAIQGSTAFNLGGVAGSIGFGALSDRLNPVIVLAAMYLLAMVATFMLGGFTSASPWLFLACLFAGIGSIGAQLCLNAFTTMLYPAPIRATGLGWALSIGRLGAITGPLAAGSLLLGGWTGQQLLQALSVVPLVCAVGILLLRGRTTIARPELAEPVH